LTQHGASALYPIFIDDTGNANTWANIYDTITALVLAAYLMFGFLGGDTWGNCPPCINAQKWMAQLRHRVNFLGFEIDTRDMMLTWPLEKRRRLQQHITTTMDYFHAGGFAPCKLLAQALSLLCNGCFVLPLGLTLSLQLQYAINNKIRAALQGHSSPCWQCIFWDTAKICLTPSIVKDLGDLSVLLEVDTPHSRAWCRPLASLYLIPPNLPS